MVKGETFMNEITIEKAFSSAMIFAGKLYGRGFQARVCELTGVDSSNLNSIMKKEKGTREPVRRAIFEAIRALVPRMAEWGYDNFLNLGFSIASDRGVIGDTLSDHAMGVLLERYALLPITGQVDIAPHLDSIKATTPINSFNEIKENQDCKIILSHETNEIPQSGKRVHELSEKEEEALLLYRKYGNPALLDECVDRLRRVRGILTSR